MLFFRWTLLLTLSGLALAYPAPAEDLSKRAPSKRETSLNAFLATLLEYLPPINGAIDTVVGVLTDFETLLGDLTGDQETYNQLGVGPCTEYTLIFARGTSEPGNVGILVGPPFIDALQDLVGSSALTVQGVNNYDASVDGYLAGGDPDGSSEM
jgi:cutinase